MGKNAIRDHQIEKLLFEAHVEKDADLIEEYFSTSGSLDPITKKALELLEGERNPSELEAIRRNLSECIIVKMQMEKGVPFQKLRSWLFDIYGQVQRAESIIQELYRRST